MTPEQERRVVEKAARQILAFEDHPGGQEGFPGTSALDVLEAATGGFGDDTARLARLALDRARELRGLPEKSPTDPKGVHTFAGGLPEYAAPHGPDGPHRPI